MIGLAALAVGLQAGSVRGEVVFGAASVALMGLAWLLGEATDQAGEHAPGRASSALLNATFGNLPEVVIVILAINAGLDDIARASIIGSVIGNVLLILGLSLVVGGWKNGIQTFNERVPAMNSSMLILGVAGLGIPTLFAALHDSDSADVLSRVDRRCAAPVLRRLPRLQLQHARAEREDEPGRARWSVREAVAALALTAVATGVVSEVLVDSIKPTVESLGVPRAVRRARSSCRSSATSPSTSRPSGSRTETGSTSRWGSPTDRASRSRSGRAGSRSSRRSLLGNELSLVFDPLQLAALAAAALVATLVARGGETNWLEGLQLLVIYLIVSVAVWLQ